MTNTISKPNTQNSYAAFGNVVDDIFQNSLRRFFDGNSWDTENAAATATVPVNIRETEQQYELDVIAPGYTKDDFTIQVDHNILTVSLRKNEEKNERKNGWVRNEFVQRAFNRSFTLDETVDLSKITAVYTNGILHIGLGKNEKAKMASRRIEVK